MTSKNSTFSILTLVLAILFGFVGGIFSDVFLPADREVELASSNVLLTESTTSFVNAWQTASPAVVSVVARKDLSDYYSRLGYLQAGGLQDVSSGTASIVSADGLLLTNRHVVQDEDAEYVVILSDGTELDAEVLDRDTLNDIALMKITEEDERIGSLPTIEFADSDAISVGQPVLAIGNALGEYANTTTAGIVSATGRQIYASSGSSGASSLVDLIQTDAAINPGNSGGPLVDLDGKLVGMNTAISTAGSGIGFAIPSNDIAYILTSYQEFGRIVRPFLGVRHVIVNDSIVEQYGLEFDYGMLIVGDDEAGLVAIEEGSSADKAGLRKGDVILSFEGKDLSGEYTLRNALSSHLVGETVRVEVWREGEVVDVEIFLEEKE